MKNWKIALIAVAVISVVLVGSIVSSIIGKTVDTASQMADQTVFNADKHVYSYEEFRGCKADYDQHLLTWINYCKQIDRLEEKGKDGGQAYNNAVMARDGSFQMMARISAKYNKMSMIGYQKVWKGKGLPERMDMPTL